jgi:hypothetical protein
MRRCAPTLKIVERMLDAVAGRQTMPELIALAAECVGRDQSLSPPDRLARRSRAGLLCWFCEKWAAIAPSLTVRFEIPVSEVPAIVARRETDLVGESAHPLSIAALLNH